MYIKVDNLIEATGLSIIHTLWISFFIYLALLLFFRVFPNTKSHVRYCLAYIALSIMFITFCTIFANHVAISNLVEGSSHDTYSLIRDRFSLTQVPMNRIPEVFHYLSFGYAIGIIFQMSLLVIGYFRVCKMKKEGLQEVPIFLRELFERSMDAMKINTRVSLYLSNKVKISLAVGYLKPVILLPIGIIAHLTEEQVECILMHELAHIRRHDYLLNLFKTFMETVLFFNPFVWLVSKIIEAEREHACDDIVLKHTNKPLPYAQALLQIAMLANCENHKLALAAAGNGKSQLFNRIKRMTGTKIRYIDIKKQCLVFACTLFAIISLAWIRSDHKQDTDKSLNGYLSPDQNQTQRLNLRTAIPLPSPPHATIKQRGTNENRKSITSFSQNQEPSHSETQGRLLNDTTLKKSSFRDIEDAIHRLDLKAKKLDNVLFEIDSDVQGKDKVISALDAERSQLVLSIDGTGQHELIKRKHHLDQSREELIRVRREMIQSRRDTVAVRREVMALKRKMMQSKRDMAAINREMLHPKRVE